LLREDEAAEDEAVEEAAGAGLQGGVWQSSLEVREFGNGGGSEEVVAGLSRDRGAGRKREQVLGVVDLLLGKLRKRRRVEADSGAE